MAILLIILSSLITIDTEYNIDEFYKKVELDSDTLNEDGDEIEFIFVKTEIKEGRYEVEIADGPGDLYEIKGTDYYIKFQTYFGYAGYGTKGLLNVGINNYGSKFIKYD